MLAKVTRLGLVGLCMLLSGRVLAQKAAAPPIKFGTVTKTDFDSRPATTDSTAAPAEYLCDYGISKIVGGNGDFKVVFERTARLRIHQKAGYEYATVRIPLYTRDGKQERITSLKGLTYNLTDGRVTQTKLVADPQVAKEKLDKNHVQFSFTMPEVREGSIVEFTYSVTSDFIFNLQDWQFEHDIPVRWSEYRANIPQFYSYKTITRGYLPFAVQESLTVPYSTSYTSASEGLAPGVTSQISGLALQLRWVLKDAPAFREEPFMTTDHDYLRSVHFELAGTNFSGNDYHDVTGKWAALWKILQQDDEFGNAISGAAPLAAEAQVLKARYPDQKARAAAVLALVQRSIKYNDQPAVFVSQPLRRSFERHAGNAADVNLLLVQTLQAAGLEATPLLISTRSHGMVQTDLPVITQFNYVAAHVALPNNTEVLLDATEPSLPFGVLPERCLNGQGCLANAAGRWVSLKSATSYTELWTTRLRLTPQGDLQGNTKLEYAGYAGLQARRQIRQSSPSEYLASLGHRWAEWQPSKLHLINPDSVHKPLAVEMELNFAGPESQPELLYIPLLKSLGAVSNPFKSDDRRYPVNFGMPHEYTSLVTLTLPAGYSVQEMPTSIALNLPDNGGRFLYQVSQSAPETVQLVTRLQLMKDEYTPSEYAALRALHQQATAKCAEMLVVRRK
ncbi:DUF3857 domain-containing protein [Hymenobacter taeanensis]|uniref:DUF3857 domain-containing protein n=1 Tax=Hymenobacter taeanensis TaxID=2735321 RepID=A0A6M6BI85_9BACT|nr:MULTISPECIES: DUF3857 domain-containing protein [Hymenobacter]QJX47514.1 DUF3857 domain-containing protein [Hymenobacter taeanensis]UOQ83001.1 DUF3857 domain-containing protein [Hymenobacter sp. 5414T-23]